MCSLRRTPKYKKTVLFYKWWENIRKKPVYFENCFINHNNIITNHIRYEVQLRKLQKYKTAYHTSSLIFVTKNFVEMKRPNILLHNFTIKIFTNIQQ